VPAGREAEVVALRAAAAAPGGLVASAADAEETGEAVASRGALGRRRAWFGGWQEVAVVERAELVPGARLPGPALILEQHTTTVVEPGWVATRDGAGALQLSRPFDPGAPARPEGGGR